METHYDNGQWFFLQGTQIEAAQRFVITDQQPDIQRRTSNGGRQDYVLTEGQADIADMF